MNTTNQDNNADNNSVSTSTSDATSGLQHSVNEIDVRIKDVSFSSLGTLHSCPRKFQLYRLRSDMQEGNPEAERNQNLTFAYGHVVGQGMQDVFAGVDEETIYKNMFLGWHADLADVNPKQNKSFYLAVNAVEKLMHMREQGFLDEWEVVEWNGKPACELSFRITFPDGFKFRGAVDVILRNKIDGRIIVLEGKTSSMSWLSQAQFKNSSQAVGYSVVLDVIFPELTSYEVLYLVYMTKQGYYEQLPFVKNYLMRANWIQEILLDIESIKMYERVGVYPTRGESCFDFFRECEYFNVCTLATQHLAKPFHSSHEDTKVYDVELTLQDIIDGQLRKIAALPAELLADSVADAVDLSGIDFESGDELL